MPYDQVGMKDFARLVETNVIAKVAPPGTASQVSPEVVADIVMQRLNPVLDQILQYIQGSTRQAR